MPPKCETPHDGGASRNSCGGCFQDSPNPFTLQAQFLVAAHHVRPELAHTLAALAFTEGAA
jgi:hypothetical protein